MFLEWRKRRYNIMQEGRGKRRRVWVVPAAILMVALLELGHKRRN